MGNSRLRKWSLPLLLAVSVGACRQGDRQEANVVRSTDAEPAPPLPVIEPPLDRAALLMEVVRAASAAALGKVEPRSSLDGKRFEIRIRFGCPQTQPTVPNAQLGAETVGNTVAEPFSVRFDATERRLRVRATPDLTLKDWPASESAEQVEALEGFWLYRPWLLNDGCPVSTDQRLAENAPAAQRVGLAQFFSDSDARTQRRDRRPYEASKVLAEGERPSPVGYNLVLSGRLRNSPAGQVISCFVTQQDRPPQCIVAAEFDRVWIEDPTSRAKLAEWGS